MGLVLLVRHAQASWGAEDYDVLSETGHEQSALLGRSLAARGLVPDVVVTGSMRRHRETAQVCADAAGWELRAEIHPGWDEYDHVEVLAKVPPPHEGELGAREVQTWVEAGTDRWTGGAYDDYAEPFADFTDRVEGALGSLGDTLGASLGGSGTALVVTSGGPVSWVTASLLGGGVPLWRRLNPVCANTGVTRVVLGRRGRTLVSFNEHSHLDGAAGALTYR